MYLVLRKYSLNLVKVENAPQLLPSSSDMRVARQAFLFLALLCGGLLLCLLVLRFSGASVWDDAYFSVRYADHLLENGVYSWNVGEDPAFGITSVLHGGWVTLLRLVLGGSPAFLLLWGSLLLGLLALYLILRLLLHYSDLNGRFYWHALAFLALTVGFNAPQLSVHFVSGMDTTLAMAYLALYLLVVKRFEPQLSPGKSLLIGVLGGLAYFVRPDLLVFTVGVPLALALFSKRRLMQLQAAYMLIFTSFALISQVFFTTQTFGTFLPLGFYAKSLHTTGEALQSAYRFTSFTQFGTFLAVNWLPILAILLGVVLNFRAWRGAFTIADKALALCLAGFGLYHLFLVVPVMGYAARFYYPAWPVLLYLGARSFVHLLNVRPAWNAQLTRWLQPKKFRLLLGVLAVVLALVAWPQRPPNVRSRLGKFSMEAVYAELGQHNWPLLDRFSILPDDLRIASTELGILSAMNPHKTIYDLVGLNDQELAQQGFDPQRLVRIQRPDLIYMPHPDYAEMIAALRADPDFQADYLLFEAEDLGAYLGVALRRDSPFFHQMQFIATDKGNNVP